MSIAPPTPRVAPYSTPLILGHRGSSAVAPENTLAAFSRAIRDGADGIEFDVRLARDQIPVVVHDATLKRTGLIDRLIRDLTAKELQDIDVGKWFDQRTSTPDQTYAGERLPTLTEVFELFGVNSRLLYIEMKCEALEAAALASAVVKGIEDFRMTNRAVVASFNLSAIGEIKKGNAGLRTAALFEPRLSQPISIVRRYRMIDLALQFGAEEIALHHSLAGRSVVQKAKRDGLDIVLWTVDEPIWIGRARSMGIKALITNDPQKMVRARNSLQST